jgi:biotin transport system substrate-specific component
VTALAEAIPRPRSRNASLAVDAALVIGGSLLLALLAQVHFRLPFTPVPITGQTFGVLLIGTAYGWVRGGLTLALYLGEIAVGLPFAAEAKGGFDVLTLVTPSGGYIWGMLLASVLTGWLANRGWDRSFGSSIGVMLLGTIVIYAVGVTWLMESPTYAGLLGHDPTLEDGIAGGLAPFIVGDTIKLLLAAGLLPAAWKLVGREPR